ncbi:uncharacterized protein [Rutidosis leptorrhynchoides]|uniref:uncharacterized protein n=1 Tax=Rutidosis leptorrhynchoides TaxID=125765 RepID=UPI003A992EB9
MVTEGIAAEIAELLREFNNMRNNNGVPNNKRDQGGPSNNNDQGRGRCSYQTFTSCNPHTFNGIEGPVGLNCWFEKLESVFRISGCNDNDEVGFATGTLSDSALTWWNNYAQSKGHNQAYALPWEIMKQRMIEEYCSWNEIKKVEREFRDLKLVGSDLTAYNKRFFELALMCPDMVTPERRKIEKYIEGLSESIQGGVTTSKPTTV